MVDFNSTFFFFCESFKLFNYLRCLMGLFGFSGLVFSDNLLNSLSVRLNKLFFSSSGHEFTANYWGDC